jgi:hypothetical protein
MASGILGQAQTTTSTVTAVYDVPTGKVAVCTINIVNTSGYDVTIDYLALSTSNTAPTAAEYIEYNVLLNSGGVLERTGVVLNDTRHIVLKSSGPVTVTVYGYEE